MTAIVMNHIVNPLEGFFKGLNRLFLTVGYARAASELARQGYHAEAKALMTEKLKLEQEKV